MSEAERTCGWEWVCGGGAEEQEHACAWHLAFFAYCCCFFHASLRGCMACNFEQAKTVDVGGSGAAGPAAAAAHHKEKASNGFTASAALFLPAAGGDGTMYEVVQGMLNRPDWDHLRRMPLVQVPCGSGNALAASTGDCAGSLHGYLSLLPLTSHTEL